jgi:hypothetical protein
LLQNYKKYRALSNIAGAICPRQRKKSQNRLKRTELLQYSTVEKPKS